MGIIEVVALTDKVAVGLCVGSLCSDYGEEQNDGVALVQQPVAAVALALGLRNQHFGYEQEQNNDGNGLELFVEVAVNHIVYLSLL